MYVYICLYVYFDFILTCVYMHVSFYTYPHEPFMVQRIDQGPAPTANRVAGQGRVLTFQRWPMDLGFRGLGFRQFRVQGFRVSGFRV